MAEPRVRPPLPASIGFLSLAATEDLRLYIDQVASDLFEERRKETGCDGCGLAYGSEGWIEAMIPDWVWKRISPSGDSGGILCITCIARRLTRAGIANVPVMLCGTEPLRAANQEEAFERGWGTAKRRIEELEQERDAANATRDNARHLVLTEAIEAFEAEGQQLAAGAIRFYRDHGSIEKLVAAQRMASRQ